MGTVVYPDFEPTYPTQPAELTAEQIRAHTKRPYIARGLHQQGRIEHTPTRVPRDRRVSPHGLIFLALGVASVAGVILAVVALVRWLAF